MPLDYNTLGQQTAAEAKKVANQITLANRPTEIGPSGTKSWTKDAKGNWTLTNTLNPELQRGLTAQQGTQADIWQGAQGMVPGVVSGLSQPWDVSGAPAAGDASAGANQQVIDAYMGQMRPELDRQRQMQEAQLIAQGLRGGDQAYGRSQYDLGNNELNARQKAVIGGYDQAHRTFEDMNTANQLWRRNSLQERELPMQEMGGLMGLGGKVQGMPDSNDFNTATPWQANNPMMNAMQGYADKMARKNAEAAKGSFGSNLFKLGSTALGSYFGGPAGGAAVNSLFSGGFGGGGGGGTSLGINPTPYDPWASMGGGVY